MKLNDREMDNKVIDVIFLIEGSAVNGAYLTDIKTNYIVPTLEHLSQSVEGSSEDRNNTSWYNNSSNGSLYGIVVYKTAQSLPGVCCNTYGPFSNHQNILSTIDKLE